MSNKVTFKHSAYELVKLAREKLKGSNEDFVAYQKIIEEALNEVLRTSRRIGPCSIPRLDWDEYYMLQAHLVATRSTCDRGPELFFDPPRKGVGAVIVKDNRLIATGYNGSPPGEDHCNEIKCDSCGSEFSPDDEQFNDHFIGPDEDKSKASYGVCECCGSGHLFGGHIMINNSCVRTLHGEENALLQCAIDGTSPVDATVFTTASPCWDCAKRMVRVGIKRLIYANDYSSRYGLSKSAYELLERAGIEVIHLDIRKVLCEF